MTKFNDEVRVQAIQLLEEGFPVRAVARELGVGHNTVRNWRNRYQSGGYDQLLKKRQHYTAEFKLEAITYRRENRLSKTLSLTSTPEYNVLTFYYQRIVKYHYLVQYLDENDNALTDEKPVITTRNNVVEIPVPVAGYVPAGSQVSPKFESLLQSKSSQYISTALGVTDPDAEAPDAQVLTFLYEPASIDISGTKAWTDGGNAYNTRPASRDGIVLTLYADGTALSPQPAYTWTGEHSDSQWGYTYQNLPAAANGQLIKYTVREQAVDSYDASYADREDGRGTDITNTLDGGTTSFAVTKTWLDSVDSDTGFDPRPAGLALTLYQSINNSEPAMMDPQPAHDGCVKAGNVWTATYSGLKAFDHGHPIVYTAQEAVPPGYVQTINDGQHITNEVVYTKVTKVWISGGMNTPQTRLRAYRQVEGEAAEVVPNASIKLLDPADNVQDPDTLLITNTVTWRGLAQADTEGRPYIFSVREVDAAGEGYTPPRTTPSRKMA